MERTLNGTRRLLALIFVIAGFGLSAAQLALPANVANMKDLDALGAQYLPAGYAAMQPNVTLEDLQRLLRQKCEKANAGQPGGGSVNATKLSEDIQQAAGKLMQCANGLANITVVLDEVERARPRGDLDVVFEKYCLRMPQARQCITDFNTALLPCLSPEERQHNAMIQRIMGKLLDFVCYKNGDQIALFIAEQGPECLEQHKDHVSTCLQNSFGHYMPSQLNISTAELPELVLGPRQCSDLHEFEGCVVRYLETCSNITPSNIVESMFRYVRKESNCQQVIDRVIREKSEAMGLVKAGAASWSSSFISSITIGLAVGVALIGF